MQTLTELRFLASSWVASKPIIHTFLNNSKAFLYLGVPLGKKRNIFIPKSSVIFPMKSLFSRNVTEKYLPNSHFLHLLHV